jgi:adenylate cyclase
MATSTKRTPIPDTPAAKPAGQWAALWGSPRSKSAILYGIVVAFLALGSVIPSGGDTIGDDSFLAGAERIAFDLQMNLLRQVRPRPIANDTVLIGIDSGSEDVFTEPVALWHRHFANAMRAIAMAKPLAIGVDVVPPERSYDDLLRPGLDLDLSLFRAIRDVRQKAPVVFAFTVDREGRAARMHPVFARVLGEAGLGVDQQLRDPDGVSRRFSERALGKHAPVPTLAGQILRALGRPVDEGYIDYSVGDTLSYLPMQSVISWMDSGELEKLRKAFDGRIVLIGYLEKSSDRWQLPVKLITIEESEGRRTLSQPGVVVHLQVLRSHLANGMLKPAPEAVRWILCLLAASLVFFHLRGVSVLVGAVALPIALTALSLTLIRGSQILMPLSSVVIALWAALVVRGVVDALESVVERTRLRRSFAGQVSPAVMKEMLGGSLSPGLGGQLADICVLFSDVRGFTTITEHMPPQVVTTLLQRYFDRMVHAVHRYDGTVDKFIGDGMMVLFGAPRKSQDPCGDAVQCALAMMTELDALNVEFEREGLPTLTIGIGINYGTVTVGNIGSSERHNYSAIGDAVNVAARIEGLTKDLGRKIIITESVVSRIGERFQFEPLGTHNVKGHSPVEVWGIRTARNAPATA